MTPPQKRQPGRFPGHINPDNLPSHVGYDPRGKGRWFYRKRDGKNRGKEIKLGDGSLSMAEIWAGVERIESGQESTFRGLSLSFQKADAWIELAFSTQEDYLKCHTSICNRTNRAGYKFGDIPLESWTVGNVRKYRDQRKKESKSRARKEVAYMKRLFAWGVEYEHCKTNPAKDVGLKGLSSARTHYPQDPDYYAGLNLAPLRIALLMHLAYLTGRRRNDLVAMKRSALESDGVFFEESKTDKACVVEWTDELRQLVDLIKEESRGSIWLFPSSDCKAEHYRLEAMDTAWQRLRTKMKKEGFEPFQFKDIRAKHATDLEETGGDATENLQHSERGLTKRHYLRKPKKVVSLR